MLWSKVDRSIPLFLSEVMSARTTVKMKSRQLEPIPQIILPMTAISWHGGAVSTSSPVSEKKPAIHEPVQRPNLSIHLATGSLRTPFGIPRITGKMDKTLWVDPSNDKSLGVDDKTCGVRKSTTTSTRSSKSLVSQILQF